MMRFTPKFLGLALLAALPTPAFAQLEVVSDSGDTAWLITAGLVALFAALPGALLLHRSRFATLEREAGMSFAVSVLVTLIFAALGYSLAFTDGSWLIGGRSSLMLGNIEELRAGTTVSGTGFAFYQLALALLPPAIILAVGAGRARFGWSLAFAALWTLITYVPIAYSVWGGGWLSDNGALDFAGGLVIHASAGVSALVLGFILSPQDQTDRGAPLLTITGAFLLWIGAMAISGGGALLATDDPGGALINAMLAASAGAMVWGIADRMIRHSTSGRGFAHGAIAGIAAIAAISGYASTGGAIVIGLVGAAVGFAARMALSRRAGGLIFAVHGASGLVGALLFALFVSPALGGPGMEGKIGVSAQFYSQAIAVAAVALWSAIGTAIAALSVAMVLPMEDESGSAPQS